MSLASFGGRMARPVGGGYNNLGQWIYHTGEKHLGSTPKDQRPFAERQLARQEADLARVREAYGIGNTPAAIANAARMRGLEQDTADVAQRQGMAGLAAQAREGRAGMANAGLWDSSVGRGLRGQSLANLYGGMAGAVQGGEAAREGMRQNLQASRAADEATVLGMDVSPQGFFSQSAELQAAAQNMYKSAWPKAIGSAAAGIGAGYRQGTEADRERQLADYYRQNQGGAQTQRTAGGD